MQSEKEFKKKIPVENSAEETGLFNRIIDANLLSFNYFVSSLNSLIGRSQTFLSRFVVAFSPRNVQLFVPSDSLELHSVDGPFFSYHSEANSN